MGASLLMGHLLVLLLIFGAAGIQYGLLSTTNAATGTIRCDDEDKNNKNWIQRYNLGYTFR